MQADLQPKSVGLFRGSAAAWRCSAFDDSTVTVSILLLLRRGWLSSLCDCSVHSTQLRAILDMQQAAKDSPSKCGRLSVGSQPAI